MTQPIEEVRTPAAEPSAPGPAPGPGEGRLAGGLPLPGLLLGLLTVFGIVAFRSLLLWDPGQRGLPDLTWFFFGSTDTSPQLLYAAAAVLLFRRRRELLAATEGDGALLPALPLLLAGCLLFAWGQHTDATDLVLVSLVLFWTGAGLLLFGARFTALLLPPLALLAFAIPLPAALVNQLVYPLQLATAEHVSWLLGAVGIPATQEGDVIELAHRPFEVIESCSGLRSIQVLMLLAFGWACFFRMPPLAGTLLVASAAVIAYGINTLRVASLVLSPDSELSTMHDLQGVAMFLLGIFALVVVDRLLLRLPLGAEQRDGAGSAGAQRDREPSQRTRRRGVALAVLLAGLVAASIGVPRWMPPEATPGPGGWRLPEEIAGWRLEERKEIDRRYLGHVAFSHRDYAAYAKQDQTVDVFVGYDDRTQRDRSLLSPKNGLPGAGWHVEARRHIVLEPGGPGVEALLARSRTARHLSYHWYLGSRGGLEETLRASLALDRSWLRRPEGLWVVRLSTAVWPVPGGKERAEARLEELAAALAPWLAAH